mmetsp:Transcript_2903/g.8620  ORF Transcript_2903/g.8620 Transcript_2903/m.8620 type:complete len:213 (+) Transcript_2903:1181-1819(+)
MFSCLVHPGDFAQTSSLPLQFLFQPGVEMEPFRRLLRAANSPDPGGVQRRRGKGRQQRILCPSTPDPEDDADVARHPRDAFLPGIAAPALHDHTVASDAHVDSGHAVLDLLRVRDHLPAGAGGLPVPARHVRPRAQPKPPEALGERPEGDAHPVYGGHGRLRLDHRRHPAQGCGLHILRHLSHLHDLPYACCAQHSHRHVRRVCPARLQQRR